MLPTQPVSLRLNPQIAVYSVSHRLGSFGRIGLFAGVVFYKKDPGRSFKIGQALFKQLCSQCHQFNGAGGKFGPELKDIFKKWKGSRRDVLQQILEPSRVVEEKFKMLGIETKDGERYFGLVQERTKTHLTIVPNPIKPVPVKIALANIESQRVTTQSPMPQGLLNLLEKQDILDLLSYLESRGDSNHHRFGK